MSKECFKKLDRAHSSVEVEHIIEGMKLFRTHYKGELVLEILVVKGFNDTKEEFEKLNQVLQEIKPDRIDISTIDRPPAYRVEAVSMEHLIELSTYLIKLPINIAYGKNYISQKRDFSKEEILDLMKRRPQSFEDVRLCFSDASLGSLKALVEENILSVKKIAGVNFYVCG